MSTIVASNHKGYRDYNVLETFESGIELKGGEVKSIRQAKVTLNDSFARVEDGQLFLYNTHINPYAEASYMNVEPTRKRRLLLHKKQIEKLESKLTQKGLTLIPLKFYFNSRGFVKVEVGLCKGKKLYDKRDDIKRRETDIAMRRILRNRR
ncbi:MAG: SsrA-binding protein SmpB [Candidatus Omnitrophica bacterium]|nr:SsrA-binding protein SmpB [Candidatus Omnitrophota bacterium]